MVLQRGLFSIYHVHATAQATERREDTATKHNEKGRYGNETDESATADRPVGGREHGTATQGDEALCVRV